MMQAADDGLAVDPGSIVLAKEYLVILNLDGDAIHR